MGKGPVRVLFNVDVRGRTELGIPTAPGWFAIQTRWYALPGYDGRFVARAARLGKPGPLEVQPGQTGQQAGAGPLIVRAGASINSYPPPGLDAYRGYRTVPGSTWVKSHGCYGWRVDGRGFTEAIVVDDVAPSR